MTHPSTKLWRQYPWIENAYTFSRKHPNGDAVVNKHFEDMKGQPKFRYVVSLQGNPPITKFASTLHRAKIEASMILSGFNKNASLHERKRFQQAHTDRRDPMLKLLERTNELLEKILEKLTN